MVRLHLSLLFAWLSFNATFIRGDHNVTFAHGLLYGRQGDVDSSTPGLSCFNYCDVGAGCGGQSCSALIKRAPNDPSHLGPGLAHNTSRNELMRRAFPEQITNNAQAAAYNIERLLQAEPTPDGFFHQTPAGQGTAAPVMYLQELRTPEGAPAPAFALGTAGLHGCTMLIIVSTRAVYMAHFWETYSTGGTDITGSGDSQTQYLQRVVQAITNTPINNPYQPPLARDPSDRVRRNHIYTAPEGDTIDYSKFNQEGDNTVVYIMSPLKDTPGIRENTKNFRDYAYNNKLALLEAELRKRGNLGRGAKYVRVGYKRLIYNIDEDGGSAPAPDHAADFAELTQPQHAKGMALFEWDGIDQWRVFIENKYSSGENRNMQKRSHTRDMLVAGGHKG